MIIFLHIPKTSGSTFNFVLENSLGIRACHTNHTKKKVFDQDDLNFARKVFPGLRSVCGHNLIDPLRLSVPDAFYMTFLREPVARVISQYLDSVRLGGNSATFEQCLRTRGGYSDFQVKFMAGERNLDKAKAFLERCSFVGLTERFDLSLHVLGKLSPYKLNLSYKRRRVTPPTPAKAALQADARLMELAREYNQLDLQLYTFALEEIFPKICAKAGFKPNDEVPSLDHYRSEIHLRFLAFSLYNMLFYRQLCKLRYNRQFRSRQFERMPGRGVPW